jgi:hypothetical protein
MVTYLVTAYCVDSNQNIDEVMEALKIIYKEKFKKMTNKDKVNIFLIIRVNVQLAPIHVSKRHSVKNNLIFQKWKGRGGGGE